MRRAVGIVFAFAVTAATAISPMGGASAAEEEREWRFAAEAYFWGASLSGDTESGAPISVGIDDIAKNLNLGFMGAAAAHNGVWGGFVDAIYLDVGESEGFTASVGGAAVPVSASLDLRGFISTFGGAYRALEFGSTTIDLTAGARFVWLDLDVDVNVAGTPFSRSSSQTNWDGVVGFRGETQLTDKLYLSYLADIGTGQSHATWQLLGAVKYRLSRVDLVAGYRYARWNFDGFQTLEDLDLHGPFGGALVRF